MPAGRHIVGGQRRGMEAVRCAWAVERPKKRMGQLMQRPSDEPVTKVKGLVSA